MENFLLVAKDGSDVQLLSTALEKDKINVVRHASSGLEALSVVDAENIEVVIVAEQLVDSDGLTFVKKLTQNHPLINTAIISSLPSDEFHKETEGLGVFMQLPQNPGAKEMEQMKGILESIGILLQGA